MTGHRRHTKALHVGSPGPCQPMERYRISFLCHHTAYLQAGKRGRSRPERYLDAAAQGNISSHTGVITLLFPPVSPLDATTQLALAEWLASNIGHAAP